MVITVLIVAFTGVENAPSQRSRPFSNGKEQRMFKRRRFKQNLSLSERLMQDVERLRLQLAMLPPGPERDHLAKQIRQNETAANIDQWLTSPGLQPPQEVRNLGE
jgi:hypothetical protein